MEQENTILQELASRATSRYNERKGRLEQYLLSLNLPNDAIEQIVADYMEAMVGGVNYHITAEHLVTFLGAMDFPALRDIDNIVLLGVLMGDYSVMFHTLIEWDKENPTERKRDNEEVEDWLKEHQRNPFCDWVVRNLWDKNYKHPIYYEHSLSIISRQVLKRYLYTCFVARYALNATKEEVEAIPAPVEYMVEDIWRGLEMHYQEHQAMEQRIAEAYDEGQEQGVEEEEQPQANGVITLSAPITKAMSDTLQSLQKMTDKQRQQAIVKPYKGQPSLLINDIVSQLFDSGAIDVRCTEQMLYKALNGLNLLQPTYNKEAHEGVFTYTLSPYEFTKLCYNREPSSEEISQMFNSLLVLSSKWWLIDGGKQFVKICDVIAGGEKNKEHYIRVVMPQEVLEYGSPILAQVQNVNALRSMQKSAPQSRFNAQIQTKGHKMEEELLDVCFAYSARLKEVEGRPAESKVRRDIQLHRSRDKQRLKGWFEQYQRKGVLTYTRYENTNGEMVYKWRLTQTPTS